jgi:type IX secretion system PorP/SprF family membrane protein
MTSQNNFDMKQLTKYILLLIVTFSFGQELNLPVWTQHLADNEFVISPTYAGIGDNFRVRANGLTQWVGIKNAPDNVALYTDFRIADRSGVGLSLFKDRNGNTHQKGVKFSYAHHLVIDYYTDQFLSFGLSYNINHFRIAIENFEGTYEQPIIDPSITDDRAVTNNNFDIGALYRYKNFYFSLNVNNILDKDLENFSDLEAEPNKLLNYQVYSGLIIESKANKSVEFEPSIFYQLFTSDKRSATDISFKYRQFNRKEDYFWAGISYRFLNDQFFKPLNIGPMAGFMKSKFYFAYSYQITANDLAGYNSGTHMITVGLDFLQGISNCACTKSRPSKRKPN